MNREPNDFRVSEIPDIDALWTESGQRRPIGQILLGGRRLSDEQIGSVLARQMEAGVRFGEAAVDLHLVQPDDIKWALAQQFNYPFLLEGQHDRYPALIAATDPFDPRSEAIRDLRSQLLSAFPAEKRLPIAVLSTDPGDGKSFMAANLAVSLSQLGGRTVLVDAALRAPRQQVNFRLEDNSATGLSAVLAGQRGRGMIQQVSGLGNLWVVTVGDIPPNPLELLQSPVFRLLMKELATAFDHVIVDTAAASRGADARVVAATCGAAILVARKDKTAFSGVQQLQRGLARMKVQVAGVVMNDY
jgi:protein-tyrosine kinase